MFKGNLHFFFCKQKAHISCALKNGLSVLFLGVICVVEILKLGYVSCKSIFSFVLYLACGVYTTQKTYGCSWCCFGEEEIRSWVTVWKVFLPQVRVEFIHVFFWYLHGFSFTFKHLTQLEFIIVRIMNYGFKLIFLNLSQYNLHTNSSFSSLISDATFVIQ